MRAFFAGAFFATGFFAFGFGLSLAGETLNHDGMLAIWLASHAASANLRPLAQLWLRLFVNSPLSIYLGHTITLLAAGLMTGGGLRAWHWLAGQA